ncbi:MAG: hypothetical protein IJ099_05510, partial [Alphaproteobacteria bacterium]|nr:hypothetical protein [Alphaproteobacteria bacterium]
MAQDTTQIQQNSTTDKEKENPLLVAQRYLNIFNQIHILNSKQKAEFEQSILKMPEIYKEHLHSIPGGKILLEYINNLQNGGKKYGSQTQSQITSIGKTEPMATTSPQANAVTGTIINSGTINLDPDFAKNLAGSLAIAFKNNNLVPGGNINELSSVISQSFNTYAQNMQKLSSDILTQNMQQFTTTQNQMREQLEQQLNWQNEVQQQFAQNLVQQVQNISASTAKSAMSAQQLNAQNNNANTTTINNVNIDSSAFNNITNAIRETEKQRRDDFKKIIEVLNKNFALKTNHQPQELPVTAITNSITEALRESSKQQLAAIKAFGETLSQSIIRSQKEFAQTLEKSLAQSEKISINKPTELPKDSKKTNLNQTLPEQNKDNVQDNQKNKNASENKQNANKNKDEPKINQPVLQKTNKTEKKQPKQENSIENAPQKLAPMTKIKDDDIDIMSAFNDEQSDNITASIADDVFIDIAGKDNETDLSDIFSDLDVPKDKTETKEIKSKTSTNNISEAHNLNEELSAAFEERVPQKKEPLQPNKPTLPTIKPEAKPQPKPKSSHQSHLYDDAMQKIKDALQSTETITINELDDVPTISLSGNNEEEDEEDNNNKNPHTEFIDTPLEDDFSAEFIPDDDKMNQEWEYVDENGNPVETDDADEWEYVDENGNPVEADDADEWEYVDENGNPVEADDADEWEYVDENGNPVEADDADEWEYVDENGNPVEADNADEWDYVDENGNPVEAD